MIVTKDFILIHFPRTAGTALCLELKKRGQVLYHVPHLTLDRLPGKYKIGQRVIAFLRNPFSWYVSEYFYHFHPRTNGRPSALSMMLSEENSVEFDRFLNNALDIKGFMARRPLAMATLQAVFRSKMTANNNYWMTEQGINNPFPEGVNTMYQFCLHHLGIMRGDIERFKFEDFTRVMRDEFGIENIPKANGSRHGDYRTYYSSRQIERMLAAEHKIMEMMYYGFEYT